MEAFGVGEILELCGSRWYRLGYDYTLIDSVRNAVKLPITVLGGAGTLQDVRELINRYRHRCIAGAFSFQGKYRAVLISILFLLRKTLSLITYYSNQSFFIQFSSICQAAISVFI